MALGSTRPVCFAPPIAEDMDSEWSRGGVVGGVDKEDTWALALVLLGSSVIRLLGILMPLVRRSVLDKVELKLLGTCGVVEKNEAPLTGEF